MAKEIPTYPLIAVHCAKMGSMPYYFHDEVDRAESIKAPRDAFAAGSLSNGEIDVRLWRDIKNEAYKEELAAACVARFGVHPNDLINKGETNVDQK